MLDIRPLHAIKGKGFQSLFSTCIEIGAKCGNVTVDTILPSRSTIKRKLDYECNLVKANLAKEIQKAIANYGLELSSHTVLVEENSIFPLFDISYNNEK